MLAHQSDKRPICVPNDIFDGWAVQLCDRFLLLDIIQHNSGRRTKNQAGCATVEYLVGLDRGFDGLHD